MQRRKLVAVSSSVLLTLGVAACDREDARDVREGINNVEEGAEDAGKEVEQGIDQLDSDGKDD